jgi:hypothetical protein
MKNWLIKKALGYAGRKLDGKKTYMGGGGKMLLGVATIISGVVGVLGNMFPDQGLPTMDYDTAFATIMAGGYAFASGLEGIGIGHKIEKSI